MTAVAAWFSPHVFGVEALRASVARASGSGLNVVRWDGVGGLPEGTLAVLVVTTGVPSDVRAASSALGRTSGIVAGPARVVAFVPVETGLSVAEAREALGGDPAIWPLDPRALVEADRAGEPLGAVAPRSKLAAAVADAAARLDLAVRQAPRARLDPESVVASVAARAWAALDRGGAASMEPVIESELSAFLASARGILSPEDAEHVRRRLRQELIGLGPIEPFFADPAVSEIMVNGAGDIFIERDGRVERAPAAYASEDRLRLAITRIVSPAGRRVDLSSPLCDVRLPDGSRANVVLPPVAVNGPTLTVRRFRPAFDGLADLVAAGALTAAQSDRLVAAVADRRNILIAGNSGAGKTTLLNALAAVIPEEERIITMEDAAELRIRKPHVVRLETRPPNAEGAGEVTMRDLVVNALRMRPDRLIVGECRGVEAVPMLQAMNTGHDGSMTTIHGNSAAEAIERLEAMTLIGAPHWPADVVRRQIEAAIHVVVYLRRTGRRRRVESINGLRELRA